LLFGVCTIPGVIVDAPRQFFQDVSLDHPSPILTAVDDKRNILHFKKSSKKYFSLSLSNTFTEGLFDYLYLYFYI